MSFGHGPALQACDKCGTSGFHCLVHVENLTIGALNPLLAAELL